MTWDNLMKQVDEYLGESGGYIEVASGLIANDLVKGDVMTADALTMGLVLLSLAVSNLHTAVESVSIGLSTLKMVLSDHVISEEAGNDGKG